MGELATLVCMKKGLSGVVIDGAVRDVDDIRMMKFPVFAKANRTQRRRTQRIRGDKCGNPVRRSICLPG